MTAQTKPKPRHHIVPEYEYSDGSLAVEFAAQYGLTADEWQADLIEDLMGEGDNGQYAAKSFGYSIPRRNGKSVVTTIVSLYDMVVNGKSVIYTSHLTKSAMEQFEFIRYYFEQTDLKKYVTKLTLRTGSEGIYLSNGASFRIFTRSPVSGRGSGCDRLWIDEAMHMVDGSLASLLPTLANSDKPALCYLGTPSMDQYGKMFADYRASVLGAEVGTLAWVEYSADENDDLDDLAVWIKANPALGSGRLTEDFILTERAGLSDIEFQTERLGMWSAAKVSAIIDPRTWELRSDSVSKISGSETLSVDVSPDKSHATISVAGPRKDGKWHVETIEQRMGIDWVEEVILAIFKAPGNTISSLVLDDRSQAMKFVPVFQKAGIPLLTTNMAQMGTACQGFYDAVMSNEIRHMGQPPLTLALSLARKRTINYGSAWAWQRASATTDLTPLVSVTLALYGARQEHLTPTVKKRRGPIRSN